MLEIPFVICSQWVRLCCGSLFVLCLRDSGDCHAVVLSLLHCSRRVFGMVSDGFQAQTRGSWISGKERAERLLANAISIDGRKEWTCKFCSESNVWTRWRCRRCYSNIPAGLQGKRQAVTAKSGEWSTGSSTSGWEEDRKTWSLEAETRSSEQGLMPWKRRKECKEGRASLLKKNGFGRYVGWVHGSRG